MEPNPSRPATRRLYYAPPALSVALLLVVGLGTIALPSADASRPTYDLGDAALVDGVLETAGTYRSWIARGSEAPAIAFDWTFAETQTSALKHDATFRLDVYGLTPAAPAVLVGSASTSRQHTGGPFEDAGRLVVPVPAAASVTAVQASLLVTAPDGQLTEVVRSVVHFLPGAEAGAEGCESQQFQGLGGVETDDDVCRTLNSVLGNCQENGDCECDSQDSLLPTTTDTDHDGVPDDQDTDDDCDHLSDELEALIPTSRTIRGDPFDMRPRDAGTVRLRVGITGYTASGTMDGIGGGADDPYVDLSAFSTRSATGRESLFDFAGFNKNSHPTNSNSQTYVQPADAATTWSTKKGEITGLSSSFADLSTWAFRGGNGASALASIPNIRLVVPVWDDDGGDSPPDQYGEDDMIASILGIAGKVPGNAFKPWPQDPLIAASGEHSISLAIQLSVDVCPAAIGWAQRVAAGDYNVFPGEMSQTVSSFVC